MVRVRSNRSGHFSNFRRTSPSYVPAVRGLALVVFAFLVPAVAAAAEVSSDIRRDGRVLFVRTYETRFGRHANIQAVDPATGRVSTVAPANVDTENPAPSPDGRRLAFTRGYFEGGPEIGLYVADARGRHARRIAPIGYSPTWSPDGSRLAYVRGGHVVVLRADGSHALRLRQADVWQVAWSPRGGRLLISRGADAPSLQLVRPDGAGLRTMRQAPLGEAFLNPAWAPDGRRIAYEHYFGCGGGKCGGGGGIEIADLQGRVSQTINGFYAAWSPSGTRLAYATSTGVFVRSVLDGSTRPLFEGGLETRGVAWQARRSGRG